MRIGILAERSEPDAKVYEKLLRKVFLQILEVEKFGIIVPETEFEPKGTLIKQLDLAIWTVANTHSVDMIVVFVDRDREKDFVRHKKQIRKKIALADQYFPSSRVVVGTAKRNIESWLWSDKDAIEATSGVSVEDIPRPERISNPQAKMRTIWKQVESAGVFDGRYSEFVVKVAHNTDIKKVLAKCPYFLKFCEDLRYVVNEIS